jgi:peptide/nickel transport system substrate-binding protein
LFCCTKEVVEKYGSDFRSHPCGTGPFQFVAWEEGLALIFRKNENYFEKILRVTGCLI